ncbi:MAG: NDP-hexose 2,3-dehydratase family protein [Streptosporangiaceae bacterium]|nr:NDP-hexose 2,3-dehydratase family protein [Streptosporangiaceae bacterium]
MPNAAIHDWLEQRRRDNDFEVTGVPFSELTGWRFEPGTGDLRHVSGRFFAIQGLRVRTEIAAWSQPIINQPEIGLLGIVTKEYGGVLYFLMQAKMEPGYANLLQLAPTVQATRSNGAAVHGGRKPHYLELFTSQEHVLVDSLQSEHGAWCLRKRNRNVVVHIPGHVPERDGFCWLTLGQILRQLRNDDVVNMNARSVLSCIPVASGHNASANGAGCAGLCTTGRSVRRILHWLADFRSRKELVQEIIPCDRVEQWRRLPDEIVHVERRRFTVRGVRVEAASREIGHWTQPLLCPVDAGLAALVICRAVGETRLLMQGRVEAGTIDVAELAPTVQCVPGGDEGPPPRYLGWVLAASAERIRYDAVQSEEGGRFYHARSRYMILEADEEFAAQPPDDYIWVTFGAATELTGLGYHLNVQARTLIAALRSILA